MTIKRVSIRLDEELHTALKYIALENHTSLQEIFLNSAKEKYSDRIKEKNLK